MSKSVAFVRCTKRLTHVWNLAVHIYLCDDSPKDYKESYNGQTFATVALRQQMIDALYQVHGIPVIRVTRVKGKGETNPKSANLNNCLKQIYGEAIPPESEVVGVFDADQAAHSHFFTSTLPWMDAGDDVALVQSPQVSGHPCLGLSWHCMLPLLGRLQAVLLLHMQLGQVCCYAMLRTACQPGSFEIWKLVTLSSSST